ncbi:lasso peptide biosynthesis B2 protein [Rubrivivax sp. RP6-9]|uniref:lasso peptide biosynthesis B2 protein n=1 Tax=Rubrivivax sp. RP6-9 TaxID=3415750 RepID=UPI003CC50980
MILLDLRRSRYLGVPGTRFAALAAVVSGWPDPDGTTQGATLQGPADVDALAAPLLRQGLLSLNPSAPRAHANAPLAEPARSLNAEELVDAVSVDAVRTVRFVRCSASAALSLRLLSLQRIADRITTRRGQGVAKTTGPASHALRVAVAAYLRLRPLLLTAQDRCLQDSLSLLGFLGAEGWRPNWVIGVTTQPFRAHAWVQAGDLVLSDLHENVRRYTPILVA